MIFNISGGGNNATALVVDTPDPAGGIIREIIATDVVNLQSGKTVTPSTSSQTVIPDVGYDALESVTVLAMPGGTDIYTPKNDGKTHLYFRLLSNDSKSICIYFMSGGTEIDWGDETTSKATGGSEVHTYNNIGLYEVSFDGAIGIFSNVDYKYRVLLEAAEIANVSSSAGMFTYCSGLKWIYYHDNTMTGSDSSYYNAYHDYNMGLQYCRLDTNFMFISEYMFRYCQAMQAIEIPSSVTSIGAKAFQYCRSLASIEIPENVTSIGDSAFQYCVNITEYHIKPTSPPTLGTNALRTGTGVVIYVPSSYVDDYKTAWSSYASYIQGE